MRRVGRFAVQRRGTILDLWSHFGARPAVVVCIHGRRWPEGGRGCVRCIARSRRPFAFENPQRPPT